MFRSGVSHRFSMFRSGVSHIFSMGSGLVSLIDSLWGSGLVSLIDSLWFRSGVSHNYPYSGLVSLNILYVQVWCSHRFSMGFRSGVSHRFSMFRSLCLS